jgi:sugar/nucleoside kinase (ribokinase family)
MTQPASLLCIGLTAVDVVALPVQTQPFEGVRLLRGMQMAPAGTAAGTALVAATLGVATRLAGAVGADPAGRFIRGELVRAGVDVGLLEMLDEVPTSSTLIPIDEAGNRMIYHLPGAAALMSLSDGLKQAAAAARAVHYAGVGARHLDGHAHSLLAAAQAHGALVTCDLIAPGAESAAELRRLLPHIDVFMPSAVEARFLTGENDLPHAARRLKDWGAAAVVIKNGAEGALALDRGGQLDLIPAVKIDQVVDTTSCGDSFCAAFIAATLRARPWRAALQFASAAASLVARGPATLGALASFEQVDQTLANTGTV